MSQPVAIQYDDDDSDLYFCIFTEFLFIFVSMYLRMYLCFVLVIQIYPEYIQLFQFLVEDSFLSLTFIFIVEGIDGGLIFCC